MKRLIASFFVVATLGGCAILDHDAEYSELEFQFLKYSESTTITQFECEYADPQHFRRLIAEDFEKVSEIRFTSDLVETNTFGSLVVSCTIRTVDNTYSATLGTTLDLRRDWRYTIQGAIRDSNIADSCFGCSGSKAIPLDAEMGFGSQDSLYMVWSGVSISHPVNF